MLHEREESEGATYALVQVDYVDAKQWYDLDANTSVAFDSRILKEVDAIKCDGEYFLVPEGSDDLAKVAVQENLVQEHEVIGTLAMLEKYLEALTWKTVEVG